MYLPKSYLFIFIALFGFSVLSYISSCTHDDDEISLISDPVFEYGDDVINVSDGYGFDKTHSSVRYETAYLGTVALLTGRFDDFGMDIEFNQDDPSSSVLTGWVALNTHNSGEPGRDRGCIIGTFGTDLNHDNTVAENLATYTSTSIEQDGQGAYNVTGTMTFNGVTSAVPGKLHYIGNTFFDANSGVRNAPLNVAGFVFEFEIAAKTVFNIQSGNISDNVKIIASGQFKQFL